MDMLMRAGSGRRELIIAVRQQAQQIKQTLSLRSLWRMNQGLGVV